MEQLFFFTETRKSLLLKMFLKCQNNFIFEMFLRRVRPIPRLPQILEICCGYFSLPPDESLNPLSRILLEKYCHENVAKLCRSLL